MSNGQLQESEFGRGLCYCLGLFLAHAEQINKYIPETLQADVIALLKRTSISTFVYAATDHLQEIETAHCPDSCRVQLAAFLHNCNLMRDRCSHSEEEARRRIEEAKELLRLIDEAHGIPTCEANYK